MSRVKAQLAQMRNLLTDYQVEPLYSGVRLAMHSSNIHALAESGAGGLLDIVFTLGINPDGKHEYVENLTLQVNVDNETLTCFANQTKCLPLYATLHLRSTWTSPTFDVERVCRVDGSSHVKGLVRQLQDTAAAFVRSQYRAFVQALREAGYFDNTDWACPLAQAFLEHLQVRTCPSTAL